MCIITFLVSFLIIAYILPFIFVFHLSYLGMVAFWTEQPFLSVLERVVVVEDDVYLPHPPGYYSPPEPYPEHVSEDQVSLGDDSCASNVSSDGDPILSFDDETTCGIDPMTTSGEDDDKPLDEMPKIHYTGDIFDLVTHNLSNTLDTSLSDTNEEALNSSTGLGTIVKGLPSLPGESRSNLLSATQHTAEDDEPELTEEEERILETALCLKPPCTFPAFSWLSDDPCPLDHIPTFSRHNVDATVVFPVRKPKPRLSPTLQSESATSLVNVNSVLGRISVSWNKAKSRLVGCDRASVMDSIRSSALFARHDIDSLPSILERDPYDSWPWIRTAIESDNSGFRDGLRRLRSSVAEI